MPVEPPFISHAQNGEDVVLWRALREIRAGRYVEVGANHPSIDSVTRAFYDRGWQGITVEPVPYYADLQRGERPRDHLVQAAVTSRPGTHTTLHVVPRTGLSTLVDAVIDRHADAGIEHVDIAVPTARLDDVLREAGWSPHEDIHFLLVDVEGAEDDVLRSVDLSVWRPWVLVVESTAPNSTTATHEGWEPELLAAGYEFCLFDGLSRFYVATERSAQLRAALSYPACVLDRYVPLQQSVCQQEVLDLRAQTAHWRTVALTHWAEAAADSAGLGPRDTEELDQLRSQLVEIQQTLSWRVTRPLRGVRRVIDRVRRR